MAQDFLINDRTRLLQRSLDGLSLRQQTIQNNLANSETPGFRASEVSFESKLKSVLSNPQEMSLSRTDSRHLSIGGDVDLQRPIATVFQPSVNASRNDENTVDVEQEMSRLAETQLMFSSIVQLMNHKLGGIRTAINEGRR